MKESYWVAHKWDKLTDNSLSLDEIKKFHQPEHHFRFSKQALLKNDNTCSSGVEQTIYIHKGKAEFVFQQESADEIDPRDVYEGQNRLILNKGEYARFPSGLQYIFNLSDADLSYFTVLKLPDDFITE